MHHEKMKPSHSHLHGYLSVRVVTNQLKVRSGKAINVRGIRLQDAQHWEGSRCTLQLRFQRFHMILVHVIVSHLVDEFSRLQTAHLRHHASQKCI